MTTKSLIAANWKMNKSVKEAVSFIEDFKNYVKDVEIVICPSFTLLNKLNESIKNTNIKLGAQNMHFEEKGAFTGEISGLMLKDVGCEYVILGHSERRQYFNETDELINKKIKAALKNKLKPILCIGENLQQRNNNQTMDIIKKQIIGDLNNVSEREIKNVIVAYEPIWAIGTGKNATPEQAEEVHKFIRELLSKKYNGNAAKNTRIIYGGSMKPENAKELLSMPDIDGGLVGGASLDAKSFAKICSVRI
ncbi:MAG TPA: triose-phosphate isomerase [Candidatus Woesearchaeota archaeon]|mgnify:CR=1 FL=1|nr:triose-phosphate isomerase [Candidatus Woesearchaeota archaeon]